MRRFARPQVFPAGVAMVALVAGLPVGASAQSEPRPSLASIGPGCCTLRVRQGDVSAAGTFRGRPEAGRLYLRPCRGVLCPGGADSAIALPPGAVVEMRSGSHAGRGMLIGAAAGAVVLTTTWLLSANRLDMEESEAILMGIPIGGLSGLLIGGLIGATVPKWRPVDP